MWMVTPSSTAARSRGAIEGCSYSRIGPLVLSNDAALRRNRKEPMSIHEAVEIVERSLCEKKPVDAPECVAEAWEIVKSAALR